MCLLFRLFGRPGPRKGWLAESFTPLSTPSAYNPGAMTIYDRTLARFSRRELMKLAWMFGGATAAAPSIHASFISSRRGERASGPGEIVTAPGFEGPAVGPRRKDLDGQPVAVPG